MTSDDAAVFHLVDPIAGLRDGRIVGDQEKGSFVLLDNALQELKGAPRVCRVQIARRFVCQNDARIVREGPRDSYALLFPA